MSWLSTMRLLLWKNFTLARRRPVATIFEILLPIAFMCILVGIRQSTLHKATQKCVGGCTYAPFSPADSSMLVLTNCTSWDMYYTPNTTEVSAIISNATTHLATIGLALGNITAKHTEQAMVDDLLNLPTTCKVGVVMNKTADGYSFALRFDSTTGGYDPAYTQDFTNTWLTQFAFPEFQTLGPRGSWNSNPLLSSRFGNDPGYPAYAFTQFHHALNLGLTDHLQLPEAQQLLGKISLQRMPYPEYWRDNFLYAIKFGLPMLTMISLTFTVLTITRNLVREKEMRLKESMKMMGLPNWAHWQAWFFQALSFLIVSMGVNALICKHGKVLEHSSASLVFVYLLAFSIASISLCFLVSTFFSKASTGAAAAGIVWFVSYIPYMFIGPNYTLFTLQAKLSSCLVSTTAMAIGAQLLGELEGRGDGAQWDTAFEPISVDDPMSFGSIIFMLLFDAVIYFLLTWYIEAVFPGEFGVPKKWYFFVTPSYWCGVRAAAADADEATPLLSAGNTGANNANARFFEREPTGLHAGVHMQQLRKVFDKKKVAVAGSTLKMYEDQITALLGHNGAGKTTSISMLTGLFPPSSGTAIINGCDIRTNITGVRKSLGICPQHNVLFDALTVEEHLRFFCRLKGVPSARIQGEVDTMIAALELLDKRHVASASLSGGMKRKLSVGIALVGGSKVVILDEPTSGMDPGARRKTWDLLTRFKKGRTILLTTHFLDEADLLGDRIAIMSDGVIECCGSSAFLKSQYGEGYHMIVVKNKACKAASVLAAIQEHVPQAYLEADIGAEATFLLPRASSHTFPALFTTLEDNKDALHILSVGVSLTTMEEVFLKVGEKQRAADADESESYQHKAQQQTRLPQNTNGYTRTRVSSTQSSINGDIVPEPCIEGTEDGCGLLEHENGERAADAAQRAHGGGVDPALLDTSYLTKHLNSGWALKLQQFRAMFLKRFLHSARSKSSAITQLLLPISFVVVALVVAQVGDIQIDSPARGLFDLTKNYGANILMYADSNGSPTSPSYKPASAFSEKLSQVLVNQVGDLTTNTKKQDFLNISTQGYVPEYSSLADYVLKFTSVPRRVAEFNKENMIGIQFSAGNATTALFNGQAYHSIEETYTLAVSAIFDVIGGVDVRATNAPLPRTPLEKAQDQSDSFEGFYIAFTILFGMSFLASSFVLFLVLERANKAKHVQFVSGVGVWSYWGAAYLWDVVNFMVPTLGCLVVFVAFNVGAYSGARLGYLFLLFVLYGMSVIPSMYLTSFFFTNASKAYTILTIANIVTGLAAMLTVQMLETTNPDIASTLKSAFLFLPNYCFGQGISDLYNNYEALSIMEELLPICREFVQDPTAGLAECCHLASKFPSQGDSPFSISCEPDYLTFAPPGIGRYVVCMLAQAIVFFIIVVLAEYGVTSMAARALMRCVGLRMGDLPDENFAAMDEDVKAERAKAAHKIHRARRHGGKVAHTPTARNGVGGTFNNPNAIAAVGQRSTVAWSSRDGDSTVIDGFGESSTDDPVSEGDDVLVVNDLCKTFYVTRGCARIPKYAVNHLSFTVPRGECFGLLGVNGAGKTTTFRMLTGDESMTSGSAVLGGYDVTAQMESARQLMGYCPQFDALVDLMTGREILFMYARLRGVLEENIPALVDSLIKAMLLEKHADKQSRTYSGGNKRKLSTAIALCGPSPVVYLDEPTTGMDPGARRHLWNTLLAAVRSGRSLVLTSHSMEECEALCTRIAIMVNGQFQCIGSLQHLKHRFGRAINITVSIDPSQREALKTHFLEAFEGVSVEDEHDAQVSFDIVSEKRNWAHVFTVLEKARETFSIDDYNVSQTTLEQVFLRFAQHQFGE